MSLCEHGMIYNTIYCERLQIETVWCYHSPPSKTRSKNSTVFASLLPTGSLGLSNGRTCVLHTAGFANKKIKTHSLHQSFKKLYTTVGWPCTAAPATPATSDSNAFTFCPKGKALVLLSTPASTTIRLRLPVFSKFAEHLSCVVTRKSATATKIKWTVNNVIICPVNCVEDNIQVHRSDVQLCHRGLSSSVPFTACYFLFYCDVD